MDILLAFKTKPVVNFKRKPVTYYFLNGFSINLHINVRNELTLILLKLMFTITFSFWITLLNVKEVLLKLVNQFANCRCCLQVFNVWALGIQARHTLKLLNYYLVYKTSLDTYRNICISWFCLHQFLISKYLKSFFRQSSYSSYDFFTLVRMWSLKHKSKTCNSLKVNP